MNFDLEFILTCQSIICNNIFKNFDLAELKKFSTLNRSISNKIRSFIFRNYKINLLNSFYSNNENIFNLSDLFYDNCSYLNNAKSCDYLNRFKNLKKIYGFYVSSKYQTKLPDTVEKIKFIKNFNKMHHFPKSLYSVQIFYEDSINLKFLPSTVTKLKCRDSTLELCNNFPPALKKLTLLCIFKGSFSFDKFPKSLTYLDILMPLNKQFDADLPNLTHLLFINYNQHVNNLPKSLTHLTFSGIFDQPVDNLPQTLIYLKFGYNFNQSVDNLPQSLTHLTFGANFNKRVDNLPKSLIHLNFGHDFNQSVDNLPQSLTHLTFGRFFNQPVDNLPKSLTHIKFGYNFNKPIKNLPPNLIYLKLDDKFNQPVLSFNKIRNIPQHYKKYIPESVQYLEFGHSFNRPLIFIPRSLKRLIIGKSFEMKFLPSNIDNIELMKK